MVKFMALMFLLFQKANDHAQADIDIFVFSQSVGVIASTFYSLIHHKAHTTFFWCIMSVFKFVLCLLLHQFAQITS